MDWKKRDRERKRLKGIGNGENGIGEREIGRERGWEEYGTERIGVKREIETEKRGTCMV